MNISEYIPEFIPLSSTQIKEVKRLRAQLGADLQTIPKQGKTVSYLGIKFIVYANVFQPFEDSKPLVQNFKIHDGDSVLDIGTGAGTIAIFAAMKGAKRVLAVDINPAAVKCAVENVRRMDLADIVEVRESDVFEQVDSGERFDVITANLPFTSDVPSDVAAQATYDPFFKVNRAFLAGVGDCLHPGGRIYFSQANFGSLDTFFQAAEKNGFQIELIGTNNLQDDPRTFYAFELTKT